MITVFGSINMDLVANTQRLPKPGETIAGNRFSTVAGGKGANQALAATRAGASVAMVGAIGTDPFAEAALALLCEAGTDLSAVQRQAGTTGTAVVLVGDDGENMIAVIPGANGTLLPEDAHRTIDRMTAGDILMLQLEIPAETVKAAMTAARAKGIRTILNLAPLVPEAAHLGRLADIVIANETEFERLAGSGPLDTGAREAALSALHAQNGQTIIVTLGAQGAIAISDRRLLRVRGLSITPLDTVGAGDTFCGTFAAAMAGGLSFEYALRRAAVAGSLACLAPGAQTAIPTAAEVSAALDGA
ncbi:ribokinase [Shinella daejeonensis]|uniref:ribokinase n=1 Tax=Shinella daejeonensis TaxID=659017 RepID=UPI0020C7EFD0|nr:ribokinase [Shinella daejeonensis]MCP8896505.1 ribokinase [Shinella daejeonensis]